MLHSISSSDSDEFDFGNISSSGGYGTGVAPQSNITLIRDAEMCAAVRAAIKDDNVEQLEACQLPRGAALPLMESGGENTGMPVLGVAIAHEAQVRSC